QAAVLALAGLFLTLGEFGLAPFLFRFLPLHLGPARSALAFGLLACGLGRLLGSGKLLGLALGFLGLPPRLGSLALGLRGLGLLRRLGLAGAPLLVLALLGGG